MEKSEMEQIEAWLQDPSFVNWINGSHAADIEKWETYFETHTHQREWAEVAKTSLSIRPRPIPQDHQNAECALAHLRQRIAAAEAQNKPTHNSSKVWRLLPRIAACFIVLIAAIGGYQMLEDHRNHIVVAANNDIQSIILEDGTKVTLNANAYLSYDKRNVRTVTLDGEAYFEVASKKETGASFSVITDDLTVIVTGTEFNVNTEDSQTSVYLDEGKVFLRFSDKGKEDLEMESGDLVSYSKIEGRILENRKAPSLETTSWKEKIITFTDAPLTEVVSTINLIYSIDIHLAESIASGQGFTGGIPVDNLDIALQTLKDLYRLDVKKDGDRYTITQPKNNK